MTEKLPRSGERGEVVDEDLEWEYSVATAGPDVRTSWHRVEFDQPKPMKCWADAFYPDGSPHGCFNDATTALGLCAECYEEMIP